MKDSVYERRKRMSWKESEPCGGKQEQVGRGESAI